MLPTVRGRPGGARPADLFDSVPSCHRYCRDLVEEVQLIDNFTHPKTQRTSNCYR